MGGFLAGIFAWLFGLLFKQPAPPSARDIENQDLGAAKTVAAQAEQNASTEQAVAQAEARAPKTQTALVQSLSDGKF